MRILVQKHPSGKGRAKIGKSAFLNPWRRNVENFAETKKAAPDCSGAAGCLVLSRIKFAHFTISNRVVRTVLSFKIKLIR